MRIIVDENIPLMTANELRSLGHNVMDIRGTDLEGIDDEELWKIVLKEKRLLISTDKSSRKTLWSSDYPPETTE